MAVMFWRMVESPDGAVTELYGARPVVYRAADQGRRAGASHHHRSLRTRSRQISPGTFAQVNQPERQRAAGAHRFLDKDSAPEQLLGALRAAADRPAHGGR